MTHLQAALDKITAQQATHKQGSAPWCVGEQLKDILRTQPETAGLVANDLDQTGMSLADCEKKIAAFAKDHRQGSVGFCGPLDADRIIRAFYGLPEAPSVPTGAPKRKTIRLADFL
ncbi:MAG: hypothetical protein U0L91_03300 [Gemmiger sp.]|uniref:hypothetical protein n=1 Tax=Gemmiger sp. TaxID=2049027 RepID=UPI002E76D0FA|nr:hypothetical protein [Gemmiger sp.]MEE0800288.1 hypothetical protein [Gemmiger sp.]